MKSLIIALIIIPGPTPTPVPCNPDAVQLCEEYRAVTVEADRAQLELSSERSFFRFQIDAKDQQIRKLKRQNRRLKFLLKK